MECYKFEKAGDVELLFLMDMVEEASFVCDLVTLLPGVCNTSTSLSSTHTQIAALVKKFLLERNTLKEFWPFPKILHNFY